MSHKVHPKIYRIGHITDWDSRWLAKKKTQDYLEEDFYIREFFKKRLKNASVEKIEIEKFLGKTNVAIFSARPGLIIGRAGSGITEIKKALEKKIYSLRKRRLLKSSMQPAVSNIEIKEIKNPWLFAVLVSQWIADQLEKRIRYRRVLKQTLDKVMANKEVKGVRAEVAGRLDGKEIARTEWLKRGRLPRQTLRADIGFGTAEALCTYGKIGVKVWIYKGEKF